MAEDIPFSLDLGLASSYDFGGTCQQCTQKQQELEELRKEQETSRKNYITLKKKIISTDQLLKQYKSKVLHCTTQEKQIEEWVRKYGVAQRDVTVIEKQLMTTLEEMEPVKRSRVELEKRIQRLEAEKKELQTQLNNAEFKNNQYEMRLANMEAARSNNEEASADGKKQRSQLENKITQQGKKINKLQTENKILKVEATKQTRQEKRLQNKLKRTEIKLVKHLDMLVENGLMTEKSKLKVMASVNRLDRNIDSEVESEFDDDSFSDFSDVEEEDDAVNMKDKTENITDKPSSAKTSDPPGHSFEATSKAEVIAAPLPGPSQPVKQQGFKPRTGGKSRKARRDSGSFYDMLKEMENLYSCPSMLSPMPPSPENALDEESEMEDDNEMSALPANSDHHFPTSSQSNESDMDTSTSLRTPHPKDAAETDSAENNCLLTRKDTTGQDLSVPDRCTVSTATVKSTMNSEGRTVESIREREDHCESRIFEMDSARNASTTLVTTVAERCENTVIVNGSRREMSVRSRKDTTESSSQLNSGIRESDSVTESSSSQVVPSTVVVSSLHSPHISNSSLCLSFPAATPSASSESQNTVVSEAAVSGSASGSVVSSFTTSLPVCHVSHLETSSTEDSVRNVPIVNDINDSDGLETASLNDSKVCNSLAVKDSTCEEELPISSAVSEESVSSVRVLNASETIIQNAHNLDVDSVHEELPVSSAVSEELVSTVRVLNASETIIQNAHNLDVDSFHSRDAVTHLCVTANTVPMFTCTTRESSDINPQTTPLRTQKPENKEHKGDEHSCDILSTDAEPLHSFLPSVRPTHQMSSRNTSVSETQVVDESLEKTSLCDITTENKNMSCPQSDADLSAKDKKTSPQNQSESQVAGGNAVSRTATQQPVHQLNVENKTTAVLCESQTQSLMPHKMSLRSDSLESEWNGNPQNRKMTSASDARVREDRSNEEKEDLLDCFLYTSDTAKSPETAEKASNSSEKENDEPLVKSNSPVRRQLGHSENETSADHKSPHQVLLGEKTLNNIVSPFNVKTVVPVPEKTDHDYDGNHHDHDTTDISGTVQGQDISGEVDSQDCGDSFQSHHLRNTLQQNVQNGLDVSSSESDNECDTDDDMKMEERRSGDGTNSETLRQCNTLQKESKDAGMKSRNKGNAEGHTHVKNNSMWEEGRLSAACSNTVFQPLVHKQNLSPRSGGKQSVCQKTRPPSDKLSSVSSSSDSEGEDTSDLSFSDSSLSPEKKGRGSRGRIRGRGQGGGVSRGRGPLSQAKPRNTENSLELVHQTKRKCQNTLKIPHKQSATSNHNMTSPKPEQQKNVSSSGISVASIVDDDSSRDSLPIGSPTHRRKVPTIVDSDSSDTNSEGVTSTKKRSVKPRQTKKSRQFYQPHYKTPAFVESEMDESEEEETVPLATSAVDKGVEHPCDSQQPQSIILANVESREMSMRNTLTHSPSKVSISHATHTVGETSNSNNHTSSPSLETKDTADDSINQTTETDSHVFSKTKRLSVSSGGFDVPSISPYKPGQRCTEETGVSGTDHLESVSLHSVHCVSPCSVSKEARSGINIKAHCVQQDFTDGKYPDKDDGHSTDEENATISGCSSKNSTEAAAGMHYTHVDHQYSKCSPREAIITGKPVTQSDTSDKSIHQHSASESVRSADCLLPSSSGDGVQVAESGISSSMKESSKCNAVRRVSHEQVLAGEGGKQETKPPSPDLESQGCEDSYLQNAADHTEISTTVSSSNLSDSVTHQKQLVHCSSKDEGISKNCGSSGSQHPQKSANASHIRPCAELSLSEIEADCEQKDSSVQPHLFRPEAVLLDPACSVASAVSVSPVSASKESVHAKLLSGKQSGLLPPAIASNNFQNGSSTTDAHADIHQTISKSVVQAADKTSGQLSVSLTHSSSTVPLLNSQQVHSSPFKRLSIEHGKGEPTLYNTADALQSSSASECEVPSDKQSSGEGPEGKTPEGVCVAPKTIESAECEVSCNKQSPIIGSEDMISGKISATPKTLESREHEVSSNKQSSTVGLPGGISEDASVTPRKPGSVSEAENASIRTVSEDLPCLSSGQSSPCLSSRPVSVDFSAVEEGDTAGKDPCQTTASGKLKDLLAICDIFCELSPLSPLSSDHGDGQLQPSVSAGRKTKKQKKRKKKSPTAEEPLSNPATKKPALDLSTIAKDAAVYAAKNKSVDITSAGHWVSSPASLIQSQSSVSTNQETAPSSQVMSSDSGHLSHVMNKKRQSSMPGMGLKLQSSNQKAEMGQPGISGAIDQAKKQMMLRLNEGSGTSCKSSAGLHASPPKPKADGKERLTEEAFVTPPRETRSSSTLQQLLSGRKRKVAGNAGATVHVIPAKRKASRHVSAAALPQKVQDAVGDYYCEANQPVESVMVHLQQIGHLSQCWQHVIRVVIMLVKSENYNLQAEIVQQCGSNQRLIQQSFLHSTEIRFLHLLLRMMEEDKGCERISLMQSLWTAIFSNGNMEKTSMIQRAALCRLFVGLCGAEGRVEEARALAYHIVLQKYDSVASLLLAIAAAWPRALARRSAADSTGAVVVLEHVVMTSISTNPAATKLGECFRCLCHWETTTLDSLNLLTVHVKELQAAAERTGSSASAQVYELSCCIQMLCAINDSMWVAKNFLERAVRSAMSKWKGKGESDISSHYLTTICRLVGHVVGSDFKSRGKVLTQLFRVHAQGLLTGPHKHPEVEAACVDMMLRLAPLKPTTVFEVLHGWYKAASPGSIPRHLKDRIVAMHNLMQSRPLPHVKLTGFDF